jgi:hypothetical protein
MITGGGDDLARASVTTDRSVHVSWVLEIDTS